MQPLRWDIFCRVIDNFGDIGVCWRLASALASRGQAVRLWVDDASALSWMAPVATRPSGVELRTWTADSPAPWRDGLRDVLRDQAADAVGDVVIEAFGCDAPQAWIAQAWIAQAKPQTSNTINSIANYSINTGASSQKRHPNPIWINLEYLSAEPYVQRSHGLPSPLMNGPAQGMTKWFFYPGFTAGTGGLISAVAQRVDSANKVPAQPHSIGQRISLFCYEPAALGDLLSQLSNAQHATQLLVTAGRAQAAVQSVISEKNSLFGFSPRYLLNSLLSIKEQPYLSQAAYDALLHSCDFNLVRGEDSLVRALWAGRAFVWQIYPQADLAHAAKLEAFLDWLQAPPDLRQFHRIWNGLQTGALPALNLPSWRACAQAARTRLLLQTDLITQLLDFVEEKRQEGFCSAS